MREFITIHAGHAELEPESLAYSKEHVRASLPVAVLQTLPQTQIFPFNFC